MQGKVCLVTGATSGIGFAAARQLASRGATVYLVGRDEEKARSATQAIIEASGNSQVDYFIGDFSSLASIRSLGNAICNALPVIDVLLNNAGVVNQTRQLSEDGFEQMFAVNHLGYFLLTNLLLDKIKAAQAGRIVNVASGAHKFCKTGINFDDIHFVEEFSSMKVYGHSKLANILFTQELARRLSDCDVTVNCLHPGGVASNLGKNNGALGKLLMGALKPFFRSIDKGAETAIYLACAEDVADKSGGYYYNCKPIPPAKWALDTEAASRLWQISSDMVNSP